MCLLYGFLYCMTFSSEIESFCFRGFSVPKFRTVIYTTKAEFDPLPGVWLWVDCYHPLVRFPRSRAYLRVVIVDMLALNKVMAPNRLLFANCQSPVFLFSSTVQSLYFHGCSPWTFFLLLCPLSTRIIPSSVRFPPFLLCPSRMINTRILTKPT
jgi:hypothetical protein